MLGKGYSIKTYGPRAWRDDLKDQAELVGFPSHLLRVLKLAVREYACFSHSTT